MVRLRFGNLPLHEVVVRLALKEPLDITLKSVVDLYELLRERFPDPGDAQHPEQAPGRAEGLQVRLVTGTVSAAYAGHKDGLVFSIYPTVVTMAWRWSWEGPTYPHFDGFESNLWWAVGRLQQAFHGQPTFSVMNMSYVNFIVSGGSPAEDFLSTYFMPKVWPAMIGGAEQFHGLNVSWRVGDVDLRFAVDRGEGSFGDGPEGGYRLLTVAGKAIPPSSRPAEALRSLHDRLQPLFLDLITEEANREWKYAGDAV